MKMKIRRKSNDCLNCRSRLDSVYNYCPLCGQENNNNDVSFGKLMTDFFSNYFALDSRFSHSIIPFFIKPGYLTNKFNVGKRMSYANPVRLYLIVSLFFFFIFSGVGKKMIADEDDDIQISTSSDKENIASSIDDITNLTAEELDEIKGELGVTFKPIMKQLPRKDKKTIIDRLGVETAASYHIKPNDTILHKTEYVSTDDDDDFLSDSKFNWNLFNEELKKNKDISDQQVYDSIYIGNASNIEQLVAKQRIKVERTEMEYFAGYALKNLPIMMFLMLPIFALLLKLLYVRRKVLYIKHLIHALHLHAFAYLFYGITLLITFYLIDDQDVSDSNALGDWINFLSFVLVSTYAYISFLKVYKQHWFKTLIKFNIHGLLYASLLMLFFAVEMAISFLMF
jgi:hypothetical protein